MRLAPCTPAVSATAAFAIAACVTLACERTPSVVAVPATADKAQPARSDPPPADGGPPQDDRRPVESAPAVLAVGDRLLQLATHAEDGAPGCGPCRIGEGPRLLVLGSLDAIARDDTWRDLDAIARLYGDDGLRALAIVAPAREGRLHGVAEPRDLATRAAELRTKQRVAMAVDVAATSAAGDAKALHEFASVVEDPTVVLTSKDGTIRWIGTAGAHWRPLDLAIVELLAQP